MHTIELNQSQKISNELKELWNVIFTKSKFT